MEIRIQKLASSDVEVASVIAALMVEHPDDKPDRTYLKDALKDDRTHLFAAMSDNSVVGYVLAYTFPAFFVPGTMAYLYDIEVVEEHRRKGIGKLLMKTILEYLRSLNVHEVWLGAATGNVEARALYHSMKGLRSDETFHDFTFKLRD